ncbi:MAG: hypothetical protein SPF34_00200 [Helicobacter sp.]|uniref:hypothetical protein n=1 Tax=Helicobacter sp. TaxID=218 RepID=UPI002A91186C|nr:hypothetical protein [Helicobacter sp.]MDY5615324.1 hypothetical protein [Helicobacter sp.]
MKCPLCEDNTQKPTLFTAKNILTSSGKISKHAFNSGGGGAAQNKILSIAKAMKQSR